MRTITNGEKLVCMTGLMAIRHTLENLDSACNSTGITPYCFKDRDMEYYEDVLMTAKEIILQGVNK
jgi:hypothetical protein